MSMKKFSLHAFLMTMLLSMVTDFTLFSQPSSKNDKIINDVVLELSPSENNPRNSEGAFITLKDGTILFAYSRYYGGASDHSKADIAARYSTDGGNSWTEKDQVLVKNYAEQNVMSVSLLRLQDGRVALFYLRKNGLHDCRLYMKTSSDEGKSWTKAILTIPAPGYFVVNNDRVVQLKNGRLIVPAAYHRRKGEDTRDMKNFDARAIAIYFISDNNGETWRESKSLWTLPVASISGLQEPGVIELNDGRIFSWARTDQGSQYGMWSSDDGDTWSPPQPTQFRSPRSPLSMKRIAENNHLLAIWNDHSGRFTLYPTQPSTAKRTPLVSAISENDGKTWKYFQQVESNPAEGYCYTAIHFIDDFVLLAYLVLGEKTTEGGGLRLRIRKIKLDWFYRETEK